MSIKREKGNNIIDFPKEYIVIDIETTGLFLGIDEIIEVGAIKYINGIEVSRFNELIKPEKKIGDFIEKKTKITNDMVKNARSEKEVLKDFIEFIGDSILVGQNVSFDINFLYDSIYKHFNKKLKNDFVDTLRITKLLLGNKLQNKTLIKIAEYYDINVEQLHRAIADIVITNEVYLKLKEDILLQYENVEKFINENKYNRKVKSKVKIKTEENFEFDENDYDKDCIFYNSICVITGKLKKERKEIKKDLLRIGAIVEDRLTKKTNFLIVGDFNCISILKGEKSSKVIKAEEYILEGIDIKIISEDSFYNIIGI